MTREQEITNAKEAFYRRILEEGGFTTQEPFEEGVEWADKHPKNEWVSVKDYLPKQDEEVLVLCSELKVAPFYKISFGHIVDKTVCQDYNGWNIPDVVYWFPMPKIPK